jgi:hypothetical protein
MGRPRLVFVLDRKTLTHGQKYEDWLKSKGSEDDKENSGAE